MTALTRLRASGSEPAGRPWAAAPNIPCPPNTAARSAARTGPAAAGSAASRRWQRRHPAVCRSALRCRPSQRLPGAPAKPVAWRSRGQSRLPIASMGASPWKPIRCPCRVAPAAWPAGRGRVRPRCYTGLAPALCRCVSHGERSPWETHRHNARVTTGQHHQAGCIMGCLPHSAEPKDGRAFAPVPIGSNRSQSRLIARSCGTQCPAKQPTNNINQTKKPYA